MWFDRNFKGSVPKPSEDIIGMQQGQRLFQESHLILTEFSKATFYASLKYHAMSGRKIKNKKFTQSAEGKRNVFNTKKINNNNQIKEDYTFG